MNLILLFKNDFTEEKICTLDGRRAEHIHKVHRAKIGDVLTVGLLNSLMGRAKVVGMDNGKVEMEVILDHEPPPPLPLILVIALPRPKMLRRILQSVASLGIKKIYLINSWRVEKSFWLSPQLKQDNLENELLLGLEQAKDTTMPEIHLKRLFKPFVTEELNLMLASDQKGLSLMPASDQKGLSLMPASDQNKDHHFPHFSTPQSKPLAIIAHPKGIIPCPERIAQNAILVMGPEGGFIDIEIKTLENIGFTTVNIGSRILRLETAVPFIVSKLF